MKINLTKQQIDQAMPKIAPGLVKYLWIQSELGTNAQAWESVEFRRRFNHFYRVRRGSEWQNAFFGELANAAERRLVFSEVFENLHKATNRYEASFASKLVASIDPTQPVIDSIVLKNLGLRLPYPGARDRIAKIVRLHSCMAAAFEAFIKTPDGFYLVSKFKVDYPRADVTKIKMVDFVLWQTRA